MTNKTTITTPKTFYGAIRGKGVVYTANEADDGFEIQCGRCGGSGAYDGPTWDDGRCYGCDGEGHLGEITTERANELYAGQIKRAEAKERKRLRICAVRDARVAALEAAHPEVAEALEAEYNRTSGRVNTFFMSVAEQIFLVDGRELTDNQINAVANSLAKRAAEQASATPLPDTTERIQITGGISSIKDVENDYGISVKVSIIDDRGFRVYGTLASSLVRDIYNNFIAQGGNGEEEDGWFEFAKGVRVTFMAKVEPSHDDIGFGFYSRPTKAEIAK